MPARNRNTRTNTKRIACANQTTTNKRVVLTAAGTNTTTNTIVAANAVAVVGAKMAHATPRAIANPMVATRPLAEPA